MMDNYDPLEDLEDIELRALRIADAVIDSAAQNIDGFTKAWMKLSDQQRTVVHEKFVKLAILGVGGHL